MARVYNNEHTREAVAEAAAPHPEFHAAAAKVLAAVKAEVASHSRTGEFASSISMEQGKVDYHIVSDGVLYDWHAEFGHFTGSKDSKGPRRWVPGINAFRSAVSRFGGY